MGDRSEVEVKAMKSVFHELAKARQIPGEPYRRWFTTSEFHLIVWESPVGTPIGFQFCYPDLDKCLALTWLQGKGFSHKRIDAGEPVGGRPKMTPILVSDEEFQKSGVADRFASAARQLGPDLAAFVADKIAQYPDP